MTTAQMQIKSADEGPASVAETSCTAASTSGHESRTLYNEEERRVIRVLWSNEIRSARHTVGLGTFGIVSEVTEINTPTTFGAPVLKDYSIGEPAFVATPLHTITMENDHRHPDNHQDSVIALQCGHDGSGRGHNHIFAGPDTITITPGACSAAGAKDERLPDEDSSTSDSMMKEESVHIANDAFLGDSTTDGMVFSQPSVTCTKYDEETSSNEKNKQGDASNLDVSLMKIILSHSVVREGPGSGQYQYRYAVKRLRPDLDGDLRNIGAEDLATEASFLQSISHPNIVRLRAVVGTPGSADFKLVLDRLYDTLATRILYWKKRIKGNFCVSIRLATCKTMQKDLGCRLAVAYDIARAFRYLHKRRIVHRDLKPQNAAFNIRGDIRLFDFGFARELRQEELVDGTDGYKWTRMAGSPRWMAPEVHRQHSYGLSSDVYSFGLLLWNLCSLEIPYGRNLTMQRLEKKVIINTERPRRLRFASDNLNNLMCQCWSDNTSERPSFDRICRDLENESFAIEEHLVGNVNDPLDRTRHLVDFSRTSLLGKLPTQEIVK